MAEGNRPGVGEVLTRFRTAAGLTVDQVAERVGVRRSQILRYETNAVEVPDHRMEAFAVAVGVLPAELELECLFHTQPQLKNKPIGREFRDLLAWVKAQQSPPPKTPRKRIAKKPNGAKPATRTPPRRRASR
jgi:transcriptional regulator with XRE-family HTH domain